MDTVEAKRKSRAELLQTIAAAKAELESLNKFSRGDKVTLSGTVQGYADEMGTLVLKLDDAEVSCELDECYLKEVSFDTDEQIQDLGRRCMALLGNAQSPDSAIAAIEAVVMQAEEAQKMPQLSKGRSGTGKKVENGTTGHSSLPPEQTNGKVATANGNSISQADTTIYVVVRRETLKPATRFDPDGKEFFNGYLNLSDCEAYRKECEDRESAWGVRGGAYKVLSFRITPAEEHLAITS